jgi:hypothetical protein
MKKLRIHATALTTLKKVAFTLFCGVACGLVSLVLMVSAAMAQLAGAPPYPSSNPSSGPVAPPPALGPLGPNDPIIGLPANPNTGNCFPFGCAYNGHYQQVYTSSQFSGPVTITELYFYNTQYNSGATAMNSGTWTISLSTTSANWNSLSPTFSTNIGLDNTPVFSGNLDQSWAAFGDTVAIVLTTPFTYNPSLGNLLMTVVATGTTAPGGNIFFDSQTDTIMGRVYCNETEGAGVDCGSTGTVQSGFGLVTGYTAVVAQQETLTVNLLDSGTGTVTDTSSAINCSEASGTVTGTCSASYPSGIQVTLTATPNSPSPSTPPSTFAGWGGACSGTGSCIVTMNSAQNVTASFDIPGQTLTQTVTTDQSTFQYNGGYPNGTDYIAQLTSGSQVTASVTEITFASQHDCNNIFNNTLFAGAQCFVSQAGGTGTATVGYELTCPGYSGTNGTCGSDSIANFFATLGSDFSFDTGHNPGLGLVGTPPNETLTYSGGNPLVGFLKYVGPDPLHPCTLNPNSPPVSVSNQISSFTLVDPGALPVKGTSGGTGSCWLVTYNTPSEAPTVAVAAPANNGVYLQNSATIADYTCTTVYNGVNTPTGGTYPPYTATGPYLTGTCSAIDSPGGSVGQGAQFDTITPGKHTFTATVLDSAANTASQPVTYYVQGSQTINFPAIPTQTYGAGPLALNATASSGLPVTYAVTSGPATVVGNMLTITGVGSVTVMASQAGDNSNAPATTSQTFGVIAASTTTTVTSSLNPSVYGQAVTFTARVTGAGNPTGSVTWSANTGCGATVLSAGAATCTTSSLTLGTNVVMATYSGDTNHVASSGTLNQVVSGPQLTLSPTSINFGNVYLFNIAVKTLTLKNTGNATLQISGVSLTFGQADHDFGLVNACPASLAPGKSCIIYLGFWADQLGTQAGTLVITDNAPGSPQQVAITGNGINRH